MSEFKPNTLYYGDNLLVLGDFPAESVDLIYLDPPFNSNRNYNVLFKESKGGESEAQIQAFEDTWHWGTESSATWDIYEGMVSKQDDVGKMLQAFVSALGYNDVTAYLTMMAPRLVELRRVLKPTGSIYLHCDPTASHYLKVLMDAVFGAVNFVNEIIWKRTTSPHNDSKQFGRIHDTILVFQKTRQRTWNTQYGPLNEEYVKKTFTRTDGSGRRYRLNELTANKPGGDVEYAWKGVRPPAGRYWAYSRANMEKFDEEGRIAYSRTGFPRIKQYLDDSPGAPIQSFWDNVPPPSSRERLGYATQKPEALLERIISASSNEGDVVLDPFCGCGTAVAAAHKLNRRWIGIDVTYLAVDLMKNRLLTTFPDDFPGGIEVDGEPADEAAALALAERDKYQFQFWAVAKLGGTSRGGENRKGADGGVDGVLAFPEVNPEKSGKAAVEWKQVIISVKGGGTGPSHVRDLIGTVENENAEMGVLVTVSKPTSAMESAAASAGVYRSSYDNKSYPKIQIVTAAEIVRGEGARIPPRAGASQYAAAPRARRGSQSKMSF